jgi:hypothetical protein
MPPVSREEDSAELAKHFLFAKLARGGATVLGAGGMGLVLDPVCILAAVGVFYILNSPGSVEIFSKLVDILPATPKRNGK